MSWERLSSEHHVTDPPWMVVRKDMVRRASGREHRYWIIEQGPWVQALPVLDDGRIVLVRQFRYGIGRDSLELPGGFAEDDDPLPAARRELAEETGYRGGEWSLLARYAPNPAVFDNWVWTYLANGVMPGQAAPDEDEDIAVEIHAPEVVPDLIERGEIVHALHVASLLTYLQRF